MPAIYSPKQLLAKRAGEQVQPLEVSATEIVKRTTSPAIKVNSITTYNPNGKPTVQTFDDTPLKVSVNRDSASESDELWFHNVTQKPLCELTRVQFSIFVTLKSRKFKDEKLTAKAAFLYDMIRDNDLKLHGDFKYKQRLFPPTMVELNDAGYLHVITSGRDWPQ